MAKIMIVDDNKDIIQTLQISVKKAGYKTAMAYDGEEFLRSVRKHKPNLVLLDVVMPGLNTSQILNELKKMGLGNLKIILVTAVRFSEEEKAVLFREPNIIDYITKPFDINDLMERLKKNVP
ncbi:response regulator [Candidatus Woesearchaeota archaeon]|nr:response regulator [Candidatus Woesearchaeota archaeon]